MSDTKFKTLVAFLNGRKRVAPAIRGVDMKEYYFPELNKTLRPSRWKPWFYWHVMRRIGLAKNVSNDALRAVTCRGVLYIYDMKK